MLRKRKDHCTTGINFDQYVLAKSYCATKSTNINPRHFNRPVYLSCVSIYLVRCEAFPIWSDFEAIAVLCKAVKMKVVKWFLILRSNSNLIIDCFKLHLREERLM